MTNPESCDCPGCQPADIVAYAAMLRMQAKSGEHDMRCAHVGQIVKDLLDKTLPEISDPKVVGDALIAASAIVLRITGPDPMANIVCTYIAHAGVALVDGAS